MMATKPIDFQTVLSAKSHSYVGFPELLGRWPVSRRTVYRAIAEKKLPRPVKISARRVGWPREVAEEFLSKFTS